MKFCINYNKKLYCINDRHKPKRNCYEMMIYILELWKISDVEKIYLYLSPEYRKRLGGKRETIRKISIHPLLNWDTIIFLERKINEITTDYFYKVLLRNGKMKTLKFTMERQYDWEKNKPLYDVYYNCKYHFHYRLSNLEEISEQTQEERLQKIIDNCRI